MIFSGFSIAMSAYWRVLAIGWILVSEVAQPGLRPPGSAGAAAGPRPVQARPGQWLPYLGRKPGLESVKDFNEYITNID